MAKVCTLSIMGILFFIQTFLIPLFISRILFLELTRTLLVFPNLLKTIMFSLNFTLNFVLSNHRLPRRSFSKDDLKMAYMALIIFMLHIFLLLVFCLVIQIILCVILFLLRIPFLFGTRGYVTVVPKL